MLFFRVPVAHLVYRLIYGFLFPLFSSLTLPSLSKFVVKPLVFLEESELLASFLKKGAPTYLIPPLG